LVDKAEYEMLEDYTRQLFLRGSRIADDMGLILVDTKYEFGKKDGKIYLIDEIHTPDSSRYFYAEGYEKRLAAGEPQKTTFERICTSVVDRKWLSRERRTNSTVHER
jgi:phosphoribosylaminoimidazole-succinocarboxamide synthase